MDFALTEEQSLLKDSLSRFVREKYDFETRKAIQASDLGMSREIWGQMAEMGLLMTPFPEEMGGLGGTGVDVMLVAEAMGEGLVIEPFLESAVIGGAFLRHGGTDAQKDEFAPQIMDGSKIFAWAYAEPTSRFDLFEASLSATRGGGDFVLSGSKSVVFAGPWADMLLVTARTSGEVRDHDGLTVFLVDADAEGVVRRDYETNDGRRASEIDFENVRVPAGRVLGEVGAAGPLIERVADHARAALCAEAVGLMRALHRATMDHAKQRKQFGRAIADFQVIQHRLVDMFTAVEQSASQAMRAALLLEDDAKRAKAVAGAKAFIGRAGRLVGQEAVQIHGGMGVTWELPAAHHFKRLTLIDRLFGDVDWATDRFARLSREEALAV